MVDALSDSGTLIMETPVHPQPVERHDWPQPPPPYGQAQGHGDPQQLFRPTEPRGMSPQDLRHIAAPQGAEAPYPASSATQTQPARAQRGASRVLVFVGVAVCTMIVVIVAGLVILGVSD